MELTVCLSFLVLADYMFVSNYYLCIRIWQIFRNPNAKYSHKENILCP